MLGFTRCSFIVLVISGPTPRYSHEGQLKIMIIRGDCHSITNIVFEVKAGYIIRIGTLHLI